MPKGKGMTIGQLNRIYELRELLNNCVDDDKAILYERELEGLEEMNEKKKKGHKNMEEISDNNNVIKKYSREWREENPEKAKRMEEKWQKDITNHPEYIEKYYKIVREGNRLYGKTPNRQKAKYRDDLKYNINCRISSLIWYSLKKNKNRDSWIDIVKYNIDDLVERLKSTMPEGYNWSDFLQGKLHIDHIIPRSAFNFTEKEDIDFKRCWALENLQLLPAEENLKKNDKLSKPFQPCLKLKVLDSIKG